MRPTIEGRAPGEVLVRAPIMELDEPVRVLLAEDKLGYEAWGLHGGGRMIIDWSRALRGQGIDVTTVILREPGRLEEHVTREGLPFLFLRRGRYDPRSLLDLVSVIRERRIQIVHCGGYGGSTFGRLAAAITGIPCIVHVHADYRHSLMGYPWYVRWVDRLLVRHTDLVLLVSAAMDAFAVEEQGFRREQLEVLHNPLDLKAFHRLGPEARAEVRNELGVALDTPVAVCVGRLEPVKGVDVLLRAWKEVNERIADAVLLLVGEGPARGELEAEASRLGVTGVRFLGFRSDVERMLGAADICAQPSRSEGLPRAVLEAMAVGLPVVASAVGGLPEVVRDGENGFTVPPEDPSALSDALVRLLGDPKLRARLGEGALRSVQELDLSVAATRLERIYRRLLANGRAAGRQRAAGRPRAAGRRWTAGRRRAVR